MLRQLGADFGFAPVVIAGCTILYVLTLLASGNAMFQPGLSFLSPSTNALFLFGMSGAVPVFGFGWWWTLLTASWLHGNLLHILFNMMWVRDLGSAMVDFYGPSRTVIIYTVSGVCGFLLSSVTGYALGGIPIPLLHGASYTIGASAAIFGLLGAMVHYGRRGGGSSFVYSTAMRYAVIMFIFGFIMPGIDNYAHAGGFLGGYGASALLKPNTRERGDHMIVAAVCILATIAALVFNVVHALPLFTA
jgi:rhomboid protease GluP